MIDGEHVPAAFELDAVSDESEGHGVSVRLEADQVVVGDDARGACLEAEARLGAGVDEMESLAFEALDGPLVGGAVRWIARVSANRLSPRSR